MGSNPNTYTLAGYEAAEPPHYKHEYEIKRNNAKSGIDSLRDSLITVLDDLYRPDPKPFTGQFPKPYEDGALWTAVRELQLARKVQVYNSSAKAFNASIDDKEHCQLAELLNSQGHQIKGFPTKIGDLDDKLSDETVIHILFELGVIQYHHHGVHTLSKEAQKGHPSRFPEAADTVGSDMNGVVEYNSVLSHHHHSPHYLHTTYDHSEAAQKRRKRQLRAAIGLHPFPVTIAFYIP